MPKQTWKPDPTFYPSPRMAVKAPKEKLAYVSCINVQPERGPDAMCVVDVDTMSRTYGQILSRVDMPELGDELHHFGWNACSSALCPYAPHPHMERRYLVVPGLRSSRIYIMDTKNDPVNPEIVKIIHPVELASRAGYTRPHTVHCGPDGIYCSALGSPDGTGPGGIFTIDHDSFEVMGRWEMDHGPQYLAYDFWWHLGYDTMMTSEWATPDMIENGLVPELLLEGKYGHRVHVWDLKRRRHIQALEMGERNQMALELRPAHDPTKAYGFCCSVVNLDDLSGSVWLWYRERDQWAIKEVIKIPAEPADPAKLPPLLKGFKAVPPLITALDLSVDDRFLYVPCWGTGDVKQYDVTDPFHPKETGSLRMGGIADQAPYPGGGTGPLNGAPQMIQCNRDGKSLYFTNSLYRCWDDQFYPDGLRGWMTKLNCLPDGGFEPDPKFFVNFPEDLRPHQIRLQGGDASSDSYCYP